MKNSVMLRHVKPDESQKVIPVNARKQPRYFRGLPSQWTNCSFPDKYRVIAERTDVLDSRKELTVEVVSC